MSRLVPATVWVLRVLMALAIGFGGVLKVVAAPQMVDLFATIGAGQWLRYLVGLLEIAGAIGLLVPPLTGLAAGGLVALLAGAAVTNVTVVGQSPLVPVIFLLLCALIAWNQRSTVTALVAIVRSRPS